jgi:glycosyltransferase involved in cell wall biosynthesis
MCETMNNIRFSITIPVFKSKYLRECLDSVFSQTYEDFELIILNDDSPENVGGILNEYHDSRIRYYKNERNVGAINVVNNWNKLLSLAQGVYLICMGDDDKLAPNCLEEYNNLIDKYPDLDVYHARTLMIDENSSILWYCKKIDLSMNQCIQ